MLQARKIEYLQRFQAEQVEWEEHNFGKQEYHRPLKGVAEEIGEYISALYGESPWSESSFRDAFGDACVFLSSLCSKLDISLPLCFLEPPMEGQNITEVLHLFSFGYGKVCHALLKREQKIRTSEQHSQEILDGLRCIALSLVNLADRYGLDLIDDCIMPTWQEVKQRDWVLYPVNGMTA